MRIIDAEAITNSNKLATKIFSLNLTPYIKVDDLLDFIDNLSTIEAVPVVHGEWLETHDEKCGIWYYECSKCEEGFATKEKCQSLPNFCNECGAKMKGGAEWVK